MGRTSTDFVVAMVIAVSAQEGNDVADRAKDLLCLPLKRQSGCGRSQRLARSSVLPGSSLPRTHPSVAKPSTGKWWVRRSPSAWRV